MSRVSPDYEGLAERLERCDEKWLGSAGIAPLFNPDGPEAAAAIRHLVAEMDRLEEALRPFAKLADAFDGDAIDYPAPDTASLGFDYAHNKTQFTVAELRRARAALSGRKEP